MWETHTRKLKEIFKNCGRIKWKKRENGSFKVE